MPSGVLPVTFHASQQERRLVLGRQRRHEAPCKSFSMGVACCRADVRARPVRNAGFLDKLSMLQCAVSPLSALTIKELTLTGSKSAKVMFVRQERSSSFQRLSGVPINPPVSPLSARMIP